LNLFRETTSVIRTIGSSSSAILCLVIAAAATTVGGTVAAADGGYQVVLDPTNSYNFYYLHGPRQLLRMGMIGWGPQWAWTSVDAHQAAAGQVIDASSNVRLGNASLAVHLRGKRAAADKLSFEYALKAESDVPLTMVTATLGSFAGDGAMAVLAGVDGKETTIKLPATVASYDAIRQVTVSAPDWAGPVRFKLEPPLRVATDRDIRLVLASDVFTAGEKKTTVTVDFPAKVAFVVQEADVAKFAPVLTDSDWFAFVPIHDTGPSIVGLEDWLDKPAGIHGGVRMEGDDFRFEDGTPVKFWGTNLSYALNAPAKADAQFTAARFAKLGVNGLRMHKFTGANWEGIGNENDATQMQPEGLDRLDYFCQQLGQRGVYYGWSHTFNFTVRPGNKSRLAGFEELMKHGGKTYAVINWAEDVQDLLIEQVVRLLEHKNPYTGKTYAEDPALSFIELQNEDDIFFWTSSGAYDDFPTYRKLLLARYSQWLKAKYGTQEKLAAAWEAALKPDEKLAADSVTVLANPWPMSDQHLPVTRGGERTRLLDNAAFLHDTQNRFYTRFVNAIRKTGYPGPLVGSPWQAPPMLPHYYNLKSDAMVGYIDRHNYFGEALDDTMLKSPGSGYFSTGLQQVAGRPFAVSEWIHVYPSLYSAEGPVIMAAYGLGLQGWDASYEFQSTSIKPTEKDIVGQPPYGVWNADAPTQLGQNPVLSRMVLRGDVKQAPIISVRRVSPADLQQGKFNFSDTIEQKADVKTFTGSVPAESLAAGRDLVEFVDTTAPSTFPDMARYKKAGVITSATGQLKWDSAAGLITIDTDGTQGAVGFMPAKPIQLSRISIKPACKYASILATALEQKASLESGKHVLICAIARNANSGFRCLSIDGKSIIDNGHSPVMLEPVKAQISFGGRRISAVNILDHDGRGVRSQAAFQGDTFTIDGAKDKALYYEVLLE
jgi:hypothetical protein